MSDQQLSLAAVEAVAVEFVEGELVEDPVPPAAVISSLTPLPAPVLAERNLFGEAQRIAARAASGQHAPAVRVDLSRVRRLARGRARPTACGR